MRKKIDYKHLLEDVCGFTEEDRAGGYIPTMTAQQALSELCHYFLGDDWYEPTGEMRPNVVNFSIVETIESKYKGCKIRKK